jgi:hypothetical protein
VQLTEKLGPYLLSIFDPAAAALDDTQRSILFFVNESLPNLRERTFLHSETFWKALLTPDGFEGKKLLSLDVIYKRLGKFDKWIASNHNCTTIDASIWLDTDIRERHTLLLQISSQFPDHLKDTLANHFNGAYLDNIALDPGGTPAKILSQKCLVDNSSTYSVNPPRVTGIDLKSKSGNTLLGTVLQIDNALSPSFVQSYLDSMDRAKYAPNMRKLSHDRGYRFASKGHKQDNEHPNWILFGEDIGASVLLSQYANPEEQQLLRVVNFVHHLYCDFLNQQLEDTTYSTDARRKWGLTEGPGGHFDSLMTMVASPTGKNYGLHDDAKPGLCSADHIGEDGADNFTNPVNTYSKFNLVVPTVCIQNHQKRTTEVQFREKRSTSEDSIGTVTCGVVTIHIQLIGVQHTCDHLVRPVSFSFRLYHSHGIQSHYFVISNF